MVLDLGGGWGRFDPGSSPSGARSYGAPPPRVRWGGDWTADRHPDGVSSIRITCDGRAPPFCDSRGGVGGRAPPWSPPSMRGPEKGTEPF